MLWLIFLVLLVIAAAVLLLRRLRQSAERQRQLVEKYRQSDTYARIYPTLMSCRPWLVEQVRLRPEELTIRMLPPDGRMLRYSFERERGTELSPEVLYSLTQAVAIDLRGMGDKKRYLFETHRAQKKDGTAYRWYSYTIRPARKDAVLRGEAAKGEEHQRKID